MSKVTRLVLVFVCLDVGYWIKRKVVYGSENREEGTPKKKKNLSHLNLHSARKRRRKTRSAIKKRRDFMGPRGRFGQYRALGDGIQTEEKKERKKEEISSLARERKKNAHGLLQMDAQENKSSRTTMRHP